MSAHCASRDPGSGDDAGGGEVGTTGAGIDIKAQPTDQQARMRTAITGLLDDAQRAGTVRSDVGLPAILALLRGACMAADTGDCPGPVLDRSLAILLDGLRPQG